MAGSGEMMDKLGRASVGAKIGVLLAAMVVLGGVYYYFFYSDMAAEKDTLLGQRKKLSDDERKLQQRKKDYVDLLQKKLELDEELKKNAVKLPASSELPAFFVHLQTQALAANVQLIKWSRSSEIPVETYVKVPVAMEVEGDFYQLNQYFKLLFETPRIITVENLNITRSADQPTEGVLLDAKFTASTFRQADAPPAPAPGDKGAAPKGAAPGGTPPSGAPPSPPPSGAPPTPPPAPAGGK